jgi:hypothetical protein
VAVGLTWWRLAGSPGWVLAFHSVTLKQRLVLAAAAAMGPAVSLAVAIGVVANRRFFSAPDIDGAGLTTESAALRVPRAMLANTLEPAALAMPVYAALAMPCRLAN